MSASVYVRGVGVWHDEMAKPAAALLPARMRGRASPLTAMLAQVVELATRHAGVDPATLPSVFGSAYGEMHTTGTLLSQLWAADGQLSPAKFQASVHNTAAGQLSIALRNPSFTTSIAAGYDTLAMSLIEASAWLARNPGQMLVACADEAPNQVLQPAAAYSPLAAAFVLDNVSQRGLASIELIFDEIGDGSAGAHATRVAADASAQLQNPVAAAVTLARAVLAAKPTTVALHNGYRVLVEPCASGAPGAPGRSENERNYE
jgi:hypothetical protein